MKKVLIVSLIVMISVTSIFLSSCDIAKEDFQNNIKNNIYDNYETLKNKMEKSEDEEEFAKSMIVFLKEKDIKADLVTPNNIVINLTATEGYENIETNIFLIEFSKEDYKKYCQSLSVAIAVAENIEFHGNIKIILSAKSNGISKGVDELDPKYLESGNIVHLTHNKENIAMIYGAAKTKEYHVSKNVEMIKPLGKLAYKINISGISKDDSGDRNAKHVNPIVFLANFLSNSNSSGLNIEIASFKSSGKINEYPTEAEVTIVVEHSSQSKFEKRLEKEEEKFKDKNRKRDPNAKFEFSQVDVPTKVLDYDETTKLLCLLYTMEDGLFATTEEDYAGDPLGVSTIANINTGDEVSINIMSRVMNESTEIDMDTAFTMTAELSDFGIKISERYPLWKPKEKFIVEENGLQKSLKKRDIKVINEYSFVENPCSIIQSKIPEQNMISLAINLNEGTDVAIALVDYLEKMIS